MPKTPTTPKTPNSKDFQISFVYGSPLKSLDSSSKLTDCDIIRLWMQFYDDFRAGSRNLQRSEKYRIINQVVKYLITFWQSHFPSVEILQEKQVLDKVAAIINRVQIKIKKGDYGHKRKNDLKFIEGERKHVGRIFDIATTEKSPNLRSGLAKNKLKAAELVSTELIFCLLDIS